MEMLGADEHYLEDYEVRDVLADQEQFEREEYELSFEDAKKMENFKLVWITPYEDAVRTIGKFEEEGIETEKLRELDCICMIEFGNLDVEFMFYDIIKGKLDIGFMCCAKFEEDGWLSQEFTDMEFDFEELKDKDKFEKHMYDSLMKFAKHNGLMWSQLNN